MTATVVDASQVFYGTDTLGPFMPTAGGTIAAGTLLCVGNAFTAAPSATTLNSNTATIVPSSALGLYATLASSASTLTLVGTGSGGGQYFGTFAIGGGLVYSSDSSVFGTASSGSISYPANSTIVAWVFGASTDSPSFTAGVTNDSSVFGGAGNPSVRMGHADFTTAGSTTITVSGIANAAANAVIAWIIFAAPPDVTKVGFSSSAVSTSGNYTVTLPAGSASGDLICVAISHRDAVAFTSTDFTKPATTTGENLGGNATNNTTASATSASQFWCIRGASAPSMVFSRTGGSRALASCVVYRANNGKSFAFDFAALTLLSTAATAVSGTGGTTSQAGDLLVNNLFGARQITASSFNATNPGTASGATDTTTDPTAGTLIERIDTSNATSPTVSIATADAIRATAGATGSITVTASTSALHAIGIMAFTVQTAGGGVTGTLAATGTPDTAAFTGNLAASGTLAVTGAADIAAFSGNLNAFGTLAATESADIAAFAGSGSAFGTLAANETQDSAAFSGQLGLVGSLAATEATDTAAFAGAISAGVSGTLAATEASDVAALSGQIVSSGALAATETTDTAAFAGGIGVAGTLASIETPDTAAFSGAIVTSGALAATENADSAAFTGSLSAFGTLTANETPDTGSFTGQIVSSGTLAVTETTDSASFDGSVISGYTGILSATEAPDSVAFAGTSEGIPVEPDNGQGGGGTLTHYYEREEVERKRRKALQDAIERARQRIEGIEDEDTAESAETVVEQLQETVSSLPAIEIQALPLAEIMQALAQIGQQVSDLAEQRAIERLRQIEEDLDDEMAIHFLLMAA